MHQFVIRASNYSNSLWNVPPINCSIQYEILFAIITKIFLKKYIITNHSHLWLILYVFCCGYISCWLVGSSFYDQNLFFLYFIPCYLFDYFFFVIKVVMNVLFFLEQTHKEIHHHHA
jgi:hypothetical protein